VQREIDEARSEVERLLAEITATTSQIGDLMERYAKLKENGE
jgi:peptidoglycan hydrolase CwlO-like protein